MKKFDVTALGELLVDFTENGMSAQGNPLLEANPGGAPCNVLSMLQNLGKKTVQCTFHVAESWKKDCIYWESRSRHVWYNVDAGGERPGNQYR